MHAKPKDSSERWQRVEFLFHEALHMGTSERLAFLDRECVGDIELRAYVDDLLRADSFDHGFDAVDRGTGTPWLTVDEEPLAHPGARVGAFRLERRLGSGGMGTVWLAMRADEHFEQRVAVKLIKRGMDTEDVLRRFRRERQVLARLEHPNIARLLDGGSTDDGRPYLVMEHIEGQPLVEYCVENDLSVPERIRLFLLVCEAVQYAHQHLIVHRDLKPSNILVSTSGRPKLLDFGIAKILHEEDAVAPMTTSSDSRLLTPRYASPEQIKSERITTATDTYSLGVILYELLTGEVPYQLTTQSRADYERAICEQEPMRPCAMITRSGKRPITPTVTRMTAPPAGPGSRQQQRQLAGDLDTIVLKALRKEPGNRYPTVRQFADDLERYFMGLPVLARRQTWRYRAGKFVRRNKIAVAAGAMMLFTLVLASIISATFAVQESRQHDLAEQRLHDAERQAAIARAINRFLNEDLLASADPDRTSDPQVTVRHILDLASERIGTRFKDQPTVEAAILTTLGMTYEGLGVYGAAEQHLTAAYRLITRTDGKRSEAAILSAARLGDLKRLRANLTDAEPLIHSADELAREVLRPEHPTRLYVSHCLGELFIDEGRVDDAINTLEWTVRQRSAILGPDAPETLMSMDSLGVAYGLAGRFEDAERVHADLLERKTRTLGPDRLATISTVINLGFAKMNLGLYAEADSLFRKAVERARRVLGNDHPTTLIALDDLALVCSHRGKYDESEKIQREVYETRMRTLGPDHWDTLNSLANLGFLYLNSGRFEEGRALFTDLIPRVQRLHGKEHPFVITARNNLAYAQWKLGNVEGAEAGFREVVDLRRRVLGADHPDTLGATSNLAGVLIDEADYAEAEPMLDDALNTARRTLPEDHPIIGSLLHRHGICLMRIGRYDAAAKALAAARRALLASFGAGHPRVVQVDQAIQELDHLRLSTPTATRPAPPVTSPN